MDLFAGSPYDQDPSHKRSVKHSIWLMPIGPLPEIQIIFHINNVTSCISAACNKLRPRRCLADNGRTGEGGAPTVKISNSLYTPPPHPCRESLFRPPLHSSNWSPRPPGSISCMVDAGRLSGDRRTTYERRIGSPLTGIVRVKAKSVKGCAPRQRERTT